MLQRFLITWIPWIFNRIEPLYFRAQTLYKVIYNELMVRKELIFLKDFPMPIATETFGIIESKNIEWVCNLNPVTFVQPDSLTQMKHLSYIGFKIITPEEEIEISDWINDVKWKGTKEPSVKQIFFLWCCEKGKSFFHCLDEIQVEIITEMGELIKKGLNE